MKGEHVDVPLYSRDIRKVAEWAQEIHEAKSNICRTRWPKDRKEWDNTGKLAEVALGRLLGLPVDWGVWKGPGSWINFLLDDGRSIDCRGIQVEKNMNYGFKVAIAPFEIEADLVTLTLIAPDQSFARVLGYAPMDLVLTEGVLTTEWRHRGKTDPIVFPSHKLSPIGELL